MYFTFSLDTELHCSALLELQVMYYTAVYFTCAHVLYYTAVTLLYFIFVLNRNVLYLYLRYTTTKQCTLPELQVLYYNAVYFTFSSGTPGTILHWRLPYFNISYLKYYTTLNSILHVL